MKDLSLEAGMRMKVSLLAPSGEQAALEDVFNAACLSLGLEAGPAVFWSGGGAQGATAVRELNTALITAAAADTDVLIVGRGSGLTPGSAEALLRAAAGDPLIMALVPRDGHSAEVAQDIAREHFPPLFYVPFPHSSCLLLKTRLLNDIGLLDEAYSQWEYAVADLLMRANRYGQRTVQVNGAFNLGRAEAPECPADRERLYARYPEAEKALARHLAAPERKAESLFNTLNKQEKPIVAFDCSSFALTRDGTNEAGLRLLEAACACWRALRPAVIASPEIAKAHGLDAWPDLMCLDSDDFHVQTAAVIRLGQPWGAAEISRLLRRAPVIAVFMLDAIGYDCQYLAEGGEDLGMLWSFVCAQADIVFTQSEFTLQRLQERFVFGERCLAVVTRHSLDIAEYGSHTGDGRYVLIIGNTLRHKFVPETTDFLAPLFPEKSFVVVGGGERSYPNVRAVVSGSLNDEAFAGLYQEAEYVIFPSLYEGFGFPILHALARGKIIYARDSALNRELSLQLQCGPNLRLFTTLAELAERMRGRGHAFCSPAGGGGEKKGWKRSALEIEAALAGKLGEVDFHRVTERLRWGGALFGLGE